MYLIYPFTYVLIRFSIHFRSFDSPLFDRKKKSTLRRTCDKAGSPWAVLGETAWQIDSAVPFFCFCLLCLCFCAFLRGLLSLHTFVHATPTRISECRRFYAFAVFVTRLPGCSHRRCLPRKLLFCFCRISGVPETVVPFPPDRRDR